MHENGVPYLEHDRWLRRQGLPALVPVSRWAQDLLRRTTPVTVFITAFYLTAGVLGAAFDLVPETATEATVGFLFSVVVCAVVTVPAVLSWFAWWLIKRVPADRADRVAILVTVVALVCQSVLPQVPTTMSAAAVAIVGTISTFVLTVAFVWSGSAALLLWALRSTVQNLRAARSLASHALPVIFGLVVFTFFATWLWQLTDLLPWRRVALLALAIAVIGAIVLTPSAREVFDHPEDADAPHLTRVQRANVLVVVVTSQLLLAGILTLLLAGLLIVLGKIAITDAAMLVWLRHPPTPMTLAGTRLPVSRNLVKGALFLSTIASLTFMISMAGDTANRAQFFNPTIAEVRRVLAEFHGGGRVEESADESANGDAPGDSDNDSDQALLG